MPGARRVLITSLFQPPNRYVAHTNRTGFSFLRKLVHEYMDEAEHGDERILLEKKDDADIENQTRDTTGASDDPLATPSVTNEEDRDLDTGSLAESGEARKADDADIENQTRDTTGASDDPLATPSVTNEEDRDLDTGSLAESGEADETSDGSIKPKGQHNEQDHGTKEQVEPILDSKTTEEEKKQRKKQRKKKKKKTADNQNTKKKRGLAKPPAKIKRLTIQERGHQTLERQKSRIRLSATKAKAAIRKTIPPQLHFQTHSRTKLRPFDTYFVNQVEPVMRDLFWSSHKNNLKRVKFLIEKEKCDPNDKTNDPWKVRSSCAKTSAIILT